VVCIDVCTNGKHRSSYLSSYNAKSILNLGWCRSATYTHIKSLNWYKEHKNQICDECFRQPDNVDKDYLREHMNLLRSKEYLPDLCRPPVAKLTPAAKPISKSLSVNELQVAVLVKTKQLLSKLQKELM